MSYHCIIVYCQLPPVQALAVRTDGRKQLYAMSFCNFNIDTLILLYGISSISDHGSMLCSKD